jgi:deoxyribodipyrimidine photo-lyase
LTYNQARLRRLGEHKTNSEGDYVLYWIQQCRRLERNHALDYAVRCATELARPLVVFEGLRLTYPWASQRIHRFVLEGMRDNARAAERLGLNYWPFVETAARPGRRLLVELASRASLVVTDDFPCSLTPVQTEVLAARVDVPVFAVDGNGLIPLRLLGPPVSAAAQLRPRWHKAIAEAWSHRSDERRALAGAAGRTVEPPFEPWAAADLDGFCADLPLDATVPAVHGTTGGRESALARLREFVRLRLRGYAERRSVPSAPEHGHASGLSPYLHFGHISIEEVAEAVLDAGSRRAPWTPDELAVQQRGRREGYFTGDADVNSFLDEALIWRDLAFHWHLHRRAQVDSLITALPPWALQTLGAHARDRRTHLYRIDEWEGGATHDPLWNAAQRELVATGTIHNYLRMLWGKKVLEWSAGPEEAYQTLVQLNNKYALDGRDPNSWAGILWCFGLFDRPWGPERQTFGTVRYMSSENTARKFRLGPYYEYVTSLPTIEGVRAVTKRRP